MKLLLLIVKNLRRNMARTVTTSLALLVLAVIAILINAVFYSLDQLTSFRARDFKMVVRSRWKIPSLMPLSYLDPLSRGAASRPGDVQPEDWLAWQFYNGTLDAEKFTPENHVVLIAIDPAKMRNMMEDLDILDSELVATMTANKRGVLLPRELLEALHKRVGERFQVTGLGHDKGINLSFEIVGQLPDGTYNAGIMNETYLNDAIDSYPREHGEKHPLASRRVSMVQLKVADMEAFQRIATQIQSCGLLTDPPLECQTPSAAVASRLSTHRDLIWGMKWLLLPTVLVLLTLVVVNAIGISVRERLTEMAVLKVLGFRPGQILLLVQGEALVLGGASGLAAAGLTFGLAQAFFRDAEFLFVEEFAVPIQALWWGPVLGMMTGLVGSFAPAWSARTVRCAQVFARVIG
ncbi:MAG TPA: ABC transporter permease [Gemmataceae bacterium]|nr:ABC transporter permease [Gemmataceae bacterium]